ncbi:MAG: DUF2095 family protein [Candidatus Hermodarchaeota archaeon]
MKKNNRNKKVSKKIKTMDDEGLTVSYNNENLKQLFPHLLKEMAENTKIIKINSNINGNFLKNIPEHKNINKIYPNELYNPTAIDFIRRCTKKEEAIAILDYLLKRNEISEKDYNKYRNIISNEEGLNQLIKESGGQKQPGYYMRKYYMKNYKNQTLKTNED